MTLNPKITVNRRHQRSMTICCNIQNIAAKYLNSYDASKFYKEIFDFVNQEGIEIITDKDRKEAGLEERNENGCTPLELMLIEYYFISRMLKPIIVQMPQPTKYELIKDDDK